MLIFVFVQSGPICNKAYAAQVFLINLHESELVYSLPENVKK